METTLPSVQADDLSDQRLLQQQCQIRGREEAFRTLLGSATTAVTFLASSLIIYYLLPFYPLALSLFLAIILGMIAYRWPAIAFSIMLFFAAPAYSYQLGGVLWALGVLIAIAVVLPFYVSKLPGAALGSAVGAAAGVLMLTPYYLFSLPLLGGIALLRLRGSGFGGAWGVFTFLTFFLPFLFLADTTAVQSETIPLFLQVDYPKQPALSYIDLESLKTAFQGKMNNDISGFPGFPAYFIQGWGGITLVLTMFMAFAATPAILNMSKRIKENRILLRGLATLLSLLAIEIVFLVPLQLLGKPLGYHTGFDSWNNVGIVTGFMLAAGSAGLFLEVWLCQRSLKVNLGSDLTTLSLGLRDLLDSTKKRLDEIASVCRNKDLEDEKAVIAQSEEKLALTLESVRALAMPRLETSWSEFSNMRPQLSNLQLQLEAKLLDYLDDSRRTYKATVDGARALGMPITQNLIQPLPPSPEEQAQNNALQQQQMLNSAFQELASNLVSAGDMLVDTVKEEIDPEFSLTTIDIGRGFLRQGRYEQAARTILEDLQIIDGRIESPIVELAGRIITMAGRFKEVITSRLIPVFESIGDSDSLTQWHRAVDEVEAVANAVQGSRTLADLIGIVEQSRKLANLAMNTANELGHKSDGLETDNDRRCPERYNWGRNIHTASDVQQLLSSIESTSSKLTISSRFDVIEKAVQAVEQQVKLIKQYSQANELLINYHNIEYLLRERLRTNMRVDSSELPVKPKYAIEYLKMYAAKNSEEVTFDSKLGTLNYRPGKRASQDEILK